MLNLRSIVALLLMSGVLILTACGRPYQYTATVLEPAKQVTDFTINDQNGQPFQLSAQRGKVTLIFFGYTNCPDFCPTTMGDWKQVKQLLGEDAADVHFVLLSVDPQRDTPEALKQYLDHFDPSFIGLRPSQEQLDQLSREYGVGADAHTQHRDTADPTLHGTYSYAIDQQGRWRLLFSYGTNPQEIADDLKQLLQSS
ncbi:MAG TPA: SCO family protein [Herpetosiphonaceae bacterium]